MVLVVTCKDSFDQNILKNLVDCHNLCLVFNEALKSNVQLDKENPIIGSCLINSDRSRDYLRRIDLALGILNIQLWKTKEFNSLMKRLTSSISTTSFSILSELEVLLSLVSSVGIQNVDYQYIVNKKTPDFKVSVDNKEVIFELISLQDRGPIEHIKNIFKGVSERLNKMIEGSNYYIRIGLDTTKLQYTRKLVKRRNEGDNR